MKVELKEPKKNKISFIDKKFVLKKEKGENLLYIGSVGSGKTESLLSFLYELYKQNKANKSIYIDTKGDLSIFLKYAAILKKFNKNFQLFNFLKHHNLKFFENIDFKNETIKKELNKKDLLYLFPVLEKSGVASKDKIIKKVAEFLINLPDNDSEEEIPIFINGIGILRKMI